MIIQKNSIFQQAYFVNDIEESVKKWSKTFGAGPFVFTHHHKTDRFEYRGTKQESDVSYASGRTHRRFVEQVCGVNDQQHPYLK